MIQSLRPRYHKFSASFRGHDQFSDNVGLEETGIPWNRSNRNNIFTLMSLASTKEKGQMQILWKRLSIPLSFSMRDTINVEKTGVGSN